MYKGVDPENLGVSGVVQVLPHEPTYALELPPGRYFVSAKASLEPLLTPTRYTTSKLELVTVRVGETTSHDIIDQFAVGRLGLSLSGLFDERDVFVRGASLLLALSGSSGSGTRTDGDTLEYTVFPGFWRLDTLNLQLKNLANRDTPLMSNIIKTFTSDAAFPFVRVAPGSDTSLGELPVTLVTTKVYFDIVEPPGQPDIPVLNPSLQATKVDFNADSTQRSTTFVSASTPTEMSGQPLAGFTIVAEPGEYALNATATVRGTSTRFGGNTITFGEPVTTPEGSNVNVVLTPAQNPALQVTLQFPAVAQPGGVSTVVETALGPAPPQGLKMACGVNDSVCAPIYYDISTNAPFDGLATVCVRRLLRNSAPGLTSLLRLYHYDESRAAADRWQPLPAPPGRPVAIDCGSGHAGDLQACGCVDEASCGIDLESGLDVFLVCGMTPGFSPFAIFQAPIATSVQLTNTVEGTAYTGPAGPATLQRWTAPRTGTYRITATGAQGANATSAPTLTGGCGAEIAGDFALQAGDIVEALVGQKGTAAASNAGGGGGTFVTKNGQALVIAGGGGGVRNTATVNGRSGSTTTAGSSGSSSANYTTGFIPGGTNGAGGSRTVGLGAGGGGWSGNGASDGTDGEGGFSYLGPNQARGGAGKGCGVPAHGGYGGGGAGNGCFGAGGGGGYSGGGGGRIGGGGGSLNNGLHPANRENACTASGHGSVNITFTSP